MVSRRVIPVLSLLAAAGTLVLWLGGDSRQAPVSEPAEGHGGAGHRSGRELHRGGDTAVNPFREYDARTPAEGFVAATATGQVPQPLSPVPSGPPGHVQLPLQPRAAGAQAGDALAAAARALAHGNVEARRAAVESLGRLGGDSLPLLGQVLFGETDPTLRRRAMELLAERGGAAGHALVRAALDDPDEEVSATARRLLAAWPVADTGPGQTSAVAPTTDDNPLVGQLARPEPAERIAGIQQIYGLEPGAAVGILRRLLEQDPDAGVRRAALVALGHRDGPGAAEAVDHSIADTDPRIRSLGIDIAGRRGEGALPLLGRVLLGDVDPGVRRQALDRIIGLGGPGALAFAERALADEDGTVREAARRYLGR